MSINNTLKWIILILVLALLGGFTLERLLHDASWRKRATEKDIIIRAYKNASHHSDTTKDSIIVNGKLWLKPKEVAKFKINIEIPKPLVITKYDTEWVNLPVKYCENYFEGTYKFKTNDMDGRIRYQIGVKDCKPVISFPDIVCPTLTITNTNYVDTCKENIVKRPYFLWGVYTGANFDSFDKFPGVVVGGQTLFKEQLYVGLGGGYYKGLVGEVRIGIFFTRKNK